MSLTDAIAAETARASTQRPDASPAAEADLLRSSRFRAERQKDWTRLERIVAMAEARGVAALPYEDARDLASLYRQAAASLSVAREISLDRSLNQYLEALCCRAYLAVYAPQETFRGLLWRFLSHNGPAAMRRSAGVIGLGYLALLIGAVAGWWLYAADPAWFHTFIPSSLSGSRGPDSTREDLLAVIYSDGSGTFEGFAAFATYLASHNTMVALFCFALGVFVCAPSFALCVYNGVIIGLFLGLHQDRGILIDIAGWLSIHGVTEISAIAVAAGGGFRLGLAVLFPGGSTRTERLRAEGRDAVKVVAMAALMLLAAGLLEGFARQMVQDLEMRFIIGWGVGALWLAYFALAGRGRAT